jgi:putative acetyltransferase
LLTISQVETPAQIAAVQTLLREYFAWWQTVEPDDFDHAPSFQRREAELAGLPGLYAPPSGRLLLATQAGQPAGCVGLRSHAAGTAELKRFYVSPALRGQHIGRQLVNRLVEEAGRAGYRRIVLDTHISMTTAHALYQAAGFKIVSPPAGDLYEPDPAIIYMELTLPAG